MWSFNFYFRYYWAMIPIISVNWSKLTWDVSFPSSNLNHLIETKTGRKISIIDLYINMSDEDESDNVWLPVVYLNTGCWVLTPRDIIIFWSEMFSLKTNLCEVPAKLVNLIIIWISVSLGRALLRNVFYFKIFMFEELRGRHSWDCLLFFA